MKVPPDMRKQILATPGVVVGPATKAPTAAEATVKRNELASGPPGRFELLVPYWHPARLNELMRAHYSKRAARKASDAEMLCQACLAFGVTRANGRRAVRLTIVLGPRQRGGDPDAYHKSLHDGLVRCGALVDDSAKWLEMTAPVYVRGETMASRIEIEDIA